MEFPFTVVQEMALRGSVDTPGIMQAVWRTTQRLGTSFLQEELPLYRGKHYCPANANYCMVGQKSDVASQQLLVVADPNAYVLHKDAHYDRIYVRHYIPTGHMRLSLNGSPELEVARFAAELETALAEPLLPERATWPQEVVVCILCHHIISDNSCRLHGPNPVTTLLSVRPVE